MANNKSVLKCLNFRGVTLALLLLHVTHATAECNVCSTSNLACVAEAQYAFCDNGIPDLTQTNNCREGLVCSTFGSPICQSAADNSTIQDCKSCGQCDATNTFACLGQNVFALCLGDVVPSIKYTGTCAADAVCNVNYPYICATSNEGLVSTCPEEETTTTTTTTTPAPITPSPTNPSAYCQVIQEEGRFPMGSNLETTCHQYIRCILVNEIWRGAVYLCPGDTYYDSSTKACITDAPPRCSDSVRGIALLDIQLD